ncbi:MAG: hypothetical protein H6562_12415 [Lewinellaceae bacterium]|nr:hypothetical protein [Lewinella sp.]MCB9279715.1 hypothetical protein [Lewinellaceae bacterium]
MKNILRIAALTLLLPALASAQQVFRHSATKTNTNGHITTLDHISVNNTPGAILIVTTDFGSKGPYNPNPVGVWYAGNKWTVFNENRAAMPENTQFFVLSAPKGDNAFVHVAEAGVTSGHITTLNHAGLNNNPNARILVTQNYGPKGPYNAHPVGVYYASGKWRIFNQDKAAIPAGARFNVYIDDRTELITLATPTGNWGKIGSGATKGKSDNPAVFITQNWLTAGPYNPHETGVWYNRDDWAVFNQDRAAMPANAKFNVLTFQKNNAIMTAGSYRVADKILVKPDFNRTTRIPGRVGTNTGNTGGNTSNPGGTATPPDNTNTTPPSPQPKPEELEREGPKNINTFEWKNYIGSEYAFPNSYPLVNIYYQIFGDANAKSGYYYYLPNSYNLNWSSVNGYSLYIKFLSSTSGAKGEATVTAELTPNISNADLSMAAALLESDLKSKPGASFTELVSAPLSQPPRVSINQISSFGIDPKDISVTTPSNLAEPITISWKMQNVENLMTALFENVGLSGNLFLAPAGENMPEISIPFNIKLNDPNTFGKFEMDLSSMRSTPWVNYSPYPVVLKNVHVMKTNKSGNKALSVYTWQAGNTQVPPGAQVRFDASSIPAWVDGNASIQRVWLEYEAGACKYCDDRIENDLIGGAKGTRSRKLTFDVFDPLEYTGARMVKVKIRSVQADPNTRSKMDLPTLTITSDGETLDGGTIYVPEGSKPEFEYFLQIIMPDGTIYEADTWEVSNDPDTNILGQALIKRIVSSFTK